MSEYRTIQWERGNGYYIEMSYINGTYYVELDRGEEILWDDTFKTEEEAEDRFYELYDEYIRPSYWRDYDYEE